MGSACATTRRRRSSTRISSPAAIRMWTGRICCVSKRPIDELLRIMAALRDPENGCPWDVKQTFDTIAPYTIEEAYEVADAIDRKDYSDLRDDLGDLLLQVVFHARMAEEAGHFDFGDVVGSICDKMIRRHPHVFDRDAEKLADAEAQTLAWEEHKRRE